MQKKLLLIFIMQIPFPCIHAMQVQYSMADNPSRGDTQLHTAVKKGNYDRMSKLLQEGFDPDHTSCMLGHTALHVAASSLDVQAIELLLNQKASPEERVDGFTPLDLALWSAVGAPAIAPGGNSVHAMLIQMRSKKVDTLEQSEKAQRAISVITLLLSKIKPISEAAPTCNKKLAQQFAAMYPQALQSSDAVRTYLSHLVNNTVN